MKDKENFWYALINPVSGGGKGFRTWPKIVRLLEAQGLPYHPEITHAPGHAGELLLAGLEAGYRKFLLVGGDGTYSEVVDALFQQTMVPSTDVTLAMFPAGTGNDWHRAMQPGADARQITEWMASGNTRLEDAGKVTYQAEGLEKIRFFFNVAGMGFDAYVAAKYLNSRKRIGILSYLSGLLRGLATFKKPVASIEFQGESIETPVYIVAVGIGRFFGGGMMIAPDAVPDDGLFDLTLVKNISRFGVIGQLPRLYKGTFTSHPEVSQYRSTKVRVTSSDPLFLQVDGEMIGQVPATFEILPKQLRVVGKS